MVRMWSSMAARDDLRRGKRRPHYFGGLNPVLVLVERFNVLFSNNLCRITGDVIPQIKSSSHSFITDLLTRSVSEVAVLP